MKRLGGVRQVPAAPLLLPLLLLQFAACRCPEPFAIACLDTRRGALVSDRLWQVEVRPRR